MTTSRHGLLSGDFDVNDLMEPAAKLVRVYLCSAGPDTAKERDELVRNVYPKLRDYCRQNYGLEFQVVDLHWGESEAWEDNNADRQLCLHEIRMCQKLSAGPTFLTLFSQKYGGQQLPLSWPTDHFEHVMTALRRHRNKHTRDAFQLEQWYLRDENAVPATYVLQSEYEVISKLRPQTAVDKAIYGERKEVKWCEAKDDLKRLLRKGIEYCLQDATMTMKEAIPYLSSDFENELRAGMHDSPDPTKNNLMILRNIVDLKNYVTHKKAPKFIDLAHSDDQKLVMDTNSENRINHLRENDLPRWVPDGNQREFEVLWKEPDGISTEMHKDYLEDVCQALGEMLYQAVDRNLADKPENQLAPLEKEVLHHWSVAKQHHATFTGREEIIEIIHSYVVSSDSKPLVIHGESGSGKTATIAKAAIETHKWFDENVFTMVRFIGQTSSSFDIRQLLQSICSQLAQLFGVNPLNIPTVYKDLLNYFFKMLDNFPEDQNLVLYLDSLHMMVPQYNAHQLYWLPRSLKSNVKIILSTLPDSNNILTNLKTEVIQEENNFMELAPMTETECLSMLTALLNSENRTLTVDQQSNVLNKAFNQCGLPLYVKLLKSQAQSWSSHSDISNVQFPANCQQFIEILFRQLEYKYSKVVTSKVLSILTASSTGLSDCEMEDALSLDEEVLNEVLPMYSANTRRIPPVIWLRIKYELRDFLWCKESEGITVFFWNHRQFVNVSKDMYLNDIDRRKEIHSLLADYHLGTWAGKVKPFIRPSSANNNEVKGKADRLVPSQPLTFQSDTIIRYNKRKFDQVPRHLFLSERFDELNKMVLFSYEWLYNKCKSLSLENVLADFVLNPGVESTLVERALRDAEAFIANDVNNLAAEISGRLLPYYNTHHNIRKIIQECDTAGLTQCAFIPNFPYHQIPGSPLKYSIQCKGTPTDLQLMGTEGRFLMAKEKGDCLIQTYDLATGEHISDMISSIGNMQVTPNGKRVIIVDHKTEKALKVHDSSTGEFLGQLIPMNQVQVKPKEKYKLSDVTVSDEHVCVTVTTEMSYLFIADLMECKFLHVVGLEGRSTICKITPDAKYVFCSSNENLLAYDLRTAENVTNIALDHRPKDITFNSDTSRAFVINGIENRLYMLTLSDGSVDFLYKVNLQDAFPDDIIVNLSLSNDGEMLLVQGENNLVVYEISSEKVRCHFKRPSEVPLEFKLPGSYYQDIIFTQASFSPDDKFVIATIFRNVFIWNISTNKLLTSLQAPVGLLQDLFVPSHRGQVITHSVNSDIIQVWSIGDAIGHVGMLDRMTSQVVETAVSANDQTAFIKCKDSDEIGIVDMQSGKMLDLLTHESPVKQITVSPKGEYVFVALEEAKPNAFNKIWHVPSRKMIHEFGNVDAQSVSLENENTIFSFCQENNTFKAPFRITQFKLAEESFSEYRLEYSMNFLLCQPFITPGDKYLVTLNADAYDDALMQYTNPTICAISLKGDMSMNTYSVSYLQEKIDIKRILHIRPSPNNSYNIICIYTAESDPKELFTSRSPYNYCYGFMIFDVCSGVICQVLEEFLAPQTPINQLLFTNNVSLCIDHESNVFDMGTGYFIKRLFDTDVPPRALALEGRVALYYEENYLFAVRLSDQRCIGRVNVHGDITSLVICHDGRTILAGCKDGSITSYVLIDEVYDSVQDILKQIPSRKGEINPRVLSGLSRSWDKVEPGSVPAYSRPPSAMVGGPHDRDMLRKVKHVARSRPATTESVAYLSARSKTCSIQ